MTGFSQGSVTIIGILYIIAFILGVYLLVTSISKKIYRLLWALIPLVLVSFVILQCILEICDLTRMAMAEIILQIFSSNFFIYAAILLFIVLTAEIIITIFIYKWIRNHITGQSIAEALNDFDSGLCCYYPSGQILLLNRFMKKNMLECLEEKFIRNGEWLSKTVFEGELKSNCTRISVQGETAIVLPDKRVLIMGLNSTKIDGEEIKILSASDITEAYNKTQELYEEQGKLKDLTKKLLDYNREIVDMIASKEILNAKVKIHDSLGEELLMIRQYMESGGTEKEKEAIIDALEHSLAFLLEENSSEATDEYRLMIGTANDLGVDIVVDGILPETEPFKHILASGMHICFTNTIRHAKGDKLFLKICKTDSGLRAVFKNNGNVPLGPIEEKGGLHSLRELVEKSGGTMYIENEPEYKLEIFIPGEVF